MRQVCDGCNVLEPFEHRCHGDGCSCPECKVLSSDRRAPVQSDWKPKRVPSGTVAWFEHEMAWQEYNRIYHNDQTAEVIAQRGGFGYNEITKLLGFEPTTWEKREG